MVLEGLERGINLLVRRIAGGHRTGRSLVHDARGFPFFFFLILDVAQEENETLFLARRKCEIELVGGDRRPAGGLRAVKLPVHNGFRGFRSAVDAEELIAAGLVCIRLRVDMEDRVVPASLTILGLVVDRRSVDLHLAGGVVALEVGHVVHRVPEAEFHVGEELEAALLRVFIFKTKAKDLAGVPDRDEGGDFGGDVVLLAVYHGVAEAVAAGVGIKRRLCRLPARIPDRIAVLDIEIMAVGILRGVVVAETGQAEELRIFIEAVAAASVGDQGEEFLTPQIVDPGKRSLWSGDDVFFCLVVKITVFHEKLLSKTDEIT